MRYAAIFVAFSFTRYSSSHTFCSDGNCSIVSPWLACGWSRRVPRKALVMGNDGISARVSAKVSNRWWVLGPALLTQSDALQLSATSLLIVLGRLLRVTSAFAPNITTPNTDSLGLFHSCWFSFSFFPFRSFALAN